MTLEVVATGTWLYAGAAPSPVSIVRLDYDFWHAVAAADGDLEPDEVPSLNDAGHTYYVRFRSAESIRSSRFWPDSVGHLTLEAAKLAAAQRVSGTVRWR